MMTMKLNTTQTEATTFEPTKIHILRLKALYEKIIFRKTVTSAELVEYHSLNNRWTILFNAKHRGEKLSEAQLAFLMVKNPGRFKKNLQTKRNIRRSFGGIRPERKVTFGGQ